MNLSYSETLPFLSVKVILASLLHLFVDQYCFYAGTKFKSILGILSVVVNPKSLKSVLISINSLPSAMYCAGPSRPILKHVLRVPDCVYYHMSFHLWTMLTLNID